MRVIDQQTDDHVFQVSVKDKGSVFIDGFELSARCLEDQQIVEENATPTHVANAVRDISWTDRKDKDMSVFTDNELFSVGSKVLLEIDKLGNE
jgi:hypothetical protein